MAEFFLSDNFSACLAVGSKICDLIRFLTQQYKKEPHFRFYPFDYFDFFDQ